MVSANRPIGVHQPAPWRRFAPVPHAFGAPAWAVAKGKAMDEQRLPVNLHDFEAAARAVLPPMAYEYMAGGSGDEETLRSNREAFGRWRLLPRMMRAIAAVDPRTTVLGQEVSLPVLLAPVGLQRLAHPDGELASA